MVKCGECVEMFEDSFDQSDERFASLVVGEDEKGRVDISSVDIDMEIKPVQAMRASAQLAANW